jgi:Trk K+ transport system NAD-binding subunit
LNGLARIFIHFHLIHAPTHPPTFLQIEFYNLVSRHELLGTQIIFRTGNAMSQIDLRKVSCTTAKSILCLAPSIDLAGNRINADVADATTLQAVLALRGLESSSKSVQGPHIVAEIRDKDNEHIVTMVGAGKVETIVSHDVIGKLMIMSARQPGLAKVFMEVLGFAGDEFYTKHWPKAVGKKMGDLAPCFKDAIVIGVKRFCKDKRCDEKCTHRHNAKGHIVLNPPADYVLEESDQVIVIAEDDDTYSYSEAEAAVEGGALPQWKPAENTVEYILMAGWRRDIRDVLKFLDELVEEGSEVHMLASVPLADRTEVLLQEGLDVNTLMNITLVHHEGNSTSRPDLEELPLAKYTSIMVLAEAELEHDMMHSDSHNLNSLLLLRNVQQKFLDSGQLEKLPQCTTEILDSRTQQTISTGSTVFAGSDFVQSNEMLSQMLAMISEDPGVKIMLHELLGPGGNDITLVSCAQYCLPSERITFAQLAKKCQQKRHILCGYCNGVDGKVVINPRDKQAQKTWANCDLIVIVPPKLTLGAAGAENEEIGDHAAIKLPPSAFERLVGMNVCVDRMAEQIQLVKRLIHQKTNAKVDAVVGVVGPSEAILTLRDPEA